MRELEAALKLDRMLSFSVHAGGTLATSDPVYCALGFSSPGTLVVFYPCIALAPRLFYKRADPTFLCSQVREV